MHAARARRSTGQPSRNADTGCDVERRRHDDDAQVVARAPGLPRQREREIGVDAALVELVEDDGAEVRTAADRCCRRAVRMPSVTTSSRVSALKRRSKRTCQPTSRPSVQPRSSAIRARDRARRDAARLQQDDRAVRQQRRRHARGLAGAGRGGDRPPRASAHALDDLVDERIDRERDRSESDRREHADRRDIALCEFACSAFNVVITRSLDADRAADAGAAEAAVAVRVLREVLLVVVLGVVELRRRHDLGRDRAVAGRGQLLLKRVARALPRRAAARRSRSRCRSGTACRRRCPAACPASDRGSPRTPSADRRS